MKKYEHYDWELLDKPPHTMVYATTPRKHKWDADRRRISNAARNSGHKVKCTTAPDRKSITVERII